MAIGLCTKQIVVKRAAQKVQALLLVSAREGEQHHRNSGLPIRPVYVCMLDLLFAVITCHPALLQLPCITQTLLRDVRVPQHATMTHMLRPRCSMTCNDWLSTTLRCHLAI